MILLIAFAFIAGFVTILSPCILPLLPIILSGSVTGGKKKPLGIVTGFVLSFTFFTLFLASLVQITGISASALRSLSIIIIFVFGLSLVIPKIQVLIEQLFTRFASLGPKANTNTGFFGGIVIGITLGLVWTPCVGPILASVISLAITGSISATAFLITFSYSLGTAIPMLAITYGGQQLLRRVPWLLSNTGRIQRGFGVIMMLTALAIFLNLDRKFQTFILDTFPQYGTGLTSFEENETVSKQLQDLRQQDVNDSDMGKPSFQMLDSATNTYPQAPELIPGGEWFNSDPLTIESLRGKVVLVDFWTYSCINCIRTLPYLRSWHDKYADQGLVIIGVHAPEFEFEKSASNLAQAIQDFELEYPIVQDNNFETWRAYQNHFWPAKYLIDKDGRIRYTHFGEGDYDETERMIQDLLGETGTDLTGITIDNPNYTVESRTPELYLGYDRIEALASPESIAKDQPKTYSAPANLSNNQFAYQGTWTIGEQFAAPQADSTLTINFEAKEVFLVIRPKQPGTTVTFSILLDGKPPQEQSGADVEDGQVTVTSDRLYKLIDLFGPGRHTLELNFDGDNIELFAFTFG